MMIDGSTPADDAPDFEDDVEPVLDLQPRRRHDTGAHRNDASDTESELSDGKEV